MSLYADLGVDPDATPDQIKAAHRRAARKHHPDVGGDRAEFDRIQKAFVVLRDPDKRARYDRDGSTDDNQAPPDPALSILADAFNAALGNIEDLARGDLVHVLLRILQGELQTSIVALSMTDQEIRRNNDAIARLSHRGAKPDVLADMLTRRGVALQRQHQQLKDRAEDVRAAIRMSADYSWRCETEGNHPRPRGSVWIEIDLARAPTAPSEEHLA